MTKLYVEPSPHIRSGWTTQRIMLCVIISLLPALCAGVVYFGLKALLLAVICCASCVVFEYLFCLVTKKQSTVSDLSAIVTGLLLALNLPAEMPVYMAVIGCFVAVVVVKMLFGGIGQNFANPAMTARIVLMLSFTASMTTYPVPFGYLEEGVDAVASATPLEATAEELPTLMQMFLGERMGCLGETSILALLIGGAFLMVMKLISPVTPVAFVGTVAVLSLAVSGGDTQYMLYQIMSGGLVLGALFMATDYSTTPLTARGKLIFGIGCGLLTFLIRQYASLPEGVSYSILIMNLLTPYIDKISRPMPFGAVKEGKQSDS